MGFLSRQVQTVRLTADDPTASYLADKIQSGENIILEIRDDPAYGQQLVISSGKVPNREVQTLCESGIIGVNTYLVLADASKSHVIITLPRAFEYVGELNIVCVDATFGIELAVSDTTQNVIFDSSSVSFHAKGDAIHMINDQHDPGTWYVVGRYVSQWYA